LPDRQVMELMHKADKVNDRGGNKFYAAIDKDGKVVHDFSAAREPHPSWVGRNCRIPS